MEVKEAQEKAKKKLNDAKKKLEDAKAANSECNKEIESAQTKLNDFNSKNKDVLTNADFKIKTSESIQASIDNCNSQKKKINAEMNDNLKQQKELADSFWSLGKAEEIEKLDKENEPKRNKLIELNKNARALNKQKDNYKLNDKEQSLVDERSSLEAKVNDLKTGKCAAAFKAISDAENELNALGYNEDDIDAFAEASKSLNNKANKYNIGQIRATKNQDSRQLVDLRNLPGGINFRSNQKAMRVSVATASNDGDTILSPSKSYYMNQDYLFTNSLASPVPLGKVNFDSLPEVQTLIINEFQPYNMLSVSDLLPGAVNLLGQVALTVTNLAGGFIVTAAKNAILNKEIDKVSKNPETLYGSYVAGKSSRERKYFTSDPVKQVENMFNGGRWLNTYEIPYYEKTYLDGNTRTEAGQLVGLKNRWVVWEAF